LVVVFLLAAGGLVLYRSCINPAPGRRLTAAGGLGEKGSFAGCNVLLLTLDTTRADRLGCYGYGAIQTPTLDRLADEGVLFWRATAVTPITLPSHASILTGLYPRRHGVRSNGFFRLADEQVTLAEVLREAGYQTGAVIAAFVLNSRFGLDQGFEYYDDDLGQTNQSDPLVFAERNATRVTDSALGWLEKAAGKPFLLWVHYFDPHSAYRPPEPYAERYAASPYDGEIAYMDAELGRLIEGLERLGCGENTIVVVIGDHGEALHQHDEATHGFLLYEETMRVPFILRCGERLGGGIQRTDRVSQVDVAPTILALLGIDPPAGIDGVDLERPGATPHTCFGETYQGRMEHGWAALFSVYEEDAKYLHGPNPELYDLEHDPLEQENLYARQPERVAVLHGKLAAWFGDELESTGSPTPSKQLTKAELERLASLGYVFSSPTGSPQTAERHDPRRMMAVMRQVDQVVFGKPPSERGPETITRLEEILQENPDFVPGFRYLGLLRRAQGDLAGATAAFGRAVELHPESPELRLMLAQALARQGQTGEALENLHLLLVSFPQDPKAHLMVGRLLLASGESDTALVHLRAAFELQPDLPGCADTLEKAYTQAGRAPELEPILNEALAAEPASPDIRLAKATYLYRLERFEEARDVLREGLRLAPGNPQAINNLTRILIARPDPEGQQLAEAIALLEGLPAGVRNSDPEILLTLSQVQGLLGQINEALASCREAITLAEENRRHAVTARARQYLDQLQQARK